MKSAVCLLAATPDGKTFLSVSRRHDTSRWGLPGGKVDPGETNLEAAVREVREEIGVALPAERLEPLYSAICRGQGPDDTYWVTTYLWTGPLDTLTSLAPEEGLTVSWLYEDALTDAQRCPFASYNLGVFQAWRSYVAGY